MRMRRYMRDWHKRKQYLCTKEYVYWKQNLYVISMYKSVRIYNVSILYKVCMCAKDPYTQDSSLSGANKPQKHASIRILCNHENSVSYFPSCQVTIPGIMTIGCFICNCFDKSKPGMSSSTSSFSVILKVAFKKAKNPTAVESNLGYGWFNVTLNGHGKRYRVTHMWKHHGVSVIVFVFFFISS